jgi:hypothetical protein
MVGTFPRAAAASTGGDDASDWADAVAKMVAEQGGEGEPTLLAIGAADCLVAHFDLQPGESTRDRQALLFRLEEWLPWSAEEMVADFLCIDRSVLGIAVALSPLRGELQTLQEQGVRVNAICPGPLLAAQGWTANEHKRDRTWLQLDCSGEVNLVHLVGQHPLRWLALFDDGISVDDHGWLRNECGSVLDRLAVHGEETPESECGCGESIVLSQLSQPDHQRLLQETTEAVLAERVTPWFDFRREALAGENRYARVQRNLGVILGAFCMAAACCVVAFILQAKRYEALSEQLAESRAEEFRRVFPGQPVPTGIHARLRGEARQLAGVAGEVDELPPATSALASLHVLLSSIPDGLAFRLEEVRIDGAEVDLDGELRAHGDVNQLVTALAQHGFEVSAPHTEQISAEEVAFRVHAVFQKIRAQETQTGGVHGE